MIQNAANRPLFKTTGTVPDVSGGLQDYYQPMTFELVTKTVDGFQVLETSNPINFRGIVQPFTDRQLLLKPEGQRAWTWLLIHSDTSLSLNVDDVVIWLGKQTRVMARKDFATYGFLEYHCVQDWTGAGPY